VYFAVALMGCSDVTVIYGPITISILWHHGVLHAVRNWQNCILIVCLKAIIFVLVQLKAHQCTGMSINLLRKWYQNLNYLPHIMAAKQLAYIETKKLCHCYCSPYIKLCSLSFLKSQLEGWC